MHQTFEVPGSNPASPMRWVIALQGHCVHCTNLGQERETSTYAYKKENKKKKKTKKEKKKRRRKKERKKKKRKKKKKKKKSALIKVEVRIETV